MAFSGAASAATEFLATQWPFILTAVVASAAAWTFQPLLKGDPVSKIPLMGADIKDEAKRRQAFKEGAMKMYTAGYHKFKNSMFRVPSPRECPVVVLAPHFLGELKDVPDDYISFDGAIAEAFHTKYLDASPANSILPFVVKRGLTPALNRLTPIIAEEVDRTFQAELPFCEEFTKVAINQKLLRIVAQVSGRIFVGAEICRSEDYIDMAIHFTVQLMEAVRAIQALPLHERPSKASLLDPVKQLKSRRARTLAFFEQIIMARKKAIAEDPHYQKPDDLITWIINSEHRFRKQTLRELTETQLGLTFAAIHTTTLVATNAFYTLAAMPAMVPALRAELRGALAAHGGGGGGGGGFTPVALARMRKLDSFLCEVLRVFPLGPATFQRKVLRPLALSGGLVVPAGVVIEVAGNARAHDPALVSDPERFDMLRQYRARAQQEQLQQQQQQQQVPGAARNQMVSISPSNLTFGWGRHACPGRFFAANEIKMVVGRALLDYDMRLVDGVKERYPNLRINEAYMPDPTRELMFKRVAV